MAILAHVRTLNRFGPRWAADGAAVLGLFAMLGCLTAGPPEEIDEYKLKAAFIFNFVKFVRWPAGSFSNVKQPTTICILGRNPFEGSLAGTLAGRAIEGRPLIVRHIATAKQTPGCNVLFIGSGEDPRIASVLAAIHTPGTLTIGESDAAGDGGVMIDFKLEGGKIRFDINLDAAERADLKISSRLLSLARSVVGK
jgi:hypothetical protein